MSTLYARSLVKNEQQCSEIVRGILGFCLFLALLLWGGEAQAGLLADRLAHFPNWKSKPPVTAAEGDLIYPAWIEGTWNVTSTLVEQVAPLAPEVVTPGFEGNRRYLNEPINFLVRFKAINPKEVAIANRFFPFKMQHLGRSQLPRSDKTPMVVADRAFNGLNIAKAYLGDARVQSVKVDPDSPNRQITFLSTGRQLISIVTGRASEILDPNRFIATEVSNQFFRGTLQPYFNQVETTTAYQLKRAALRRSANSMNVATATRYAHATQTLTLKPSLAIDADQITAIYLSPQDADYFKALNRPVALYRYRLQLRPVERVAAVPTFN